MIIEYHHFNPPFIDAKEHDANAITLLCAQCHSKASRGFISNDTVAQARLDPLCKRQGFSSEYFDLGKVRPIIRIAGSEFTRTRIPISVNGQSLIEIQDPECADAPFRINGNFHNAAGTTSLQVVENEWRPFELNWDVETAGPVLTIRDGPNNISLVLRIDPPETLIVERINMRMFGFHFDGNANWMRVAFPDGKHNTFGNAGFDGARVGIAFRW